jgi:hypothetical protein
MSMTGLEPSEGATASPSLVVPVLVFLVLLAGTRLPWMLGANASTDGDEAILGLMAGAVAPGRAPPVFFYGQSYGFSSVEAWVVGIGFGLFGRSDATLHASILLLYGIGSGLLALGALRSSGRRGAAATLIFAASCPAWLLWSTKARGGYVTAWLVTNLAIALTLGNRSADGASRPAGLARWLLLGGCAAVVLWSQPLFLAALLPFLARGWLVEGRRAPPLLLAAASALATATGLALAGSSEGSSYWQPGLLDGASLLRGLVRTPERLWGFLGGLHAYARAGSAGPCHTAATAAWAVLLLLAVAGLVRNVRRRLWLSANQACLHGIVLALLAPALIGETFFGPRYLLPVGGCLILWLGLEAGERTRCAGPHRRAVLGVVVAIATLGAGAALEAAACPPSTLWSDARVATSQEVRELVGELRRRRIENVYSVDPLLQWNLLFSSGTRIRARWRHPTDRVPEYPLAVDRALFAGEAVALVGWAEDGARLASLLSRIGYAAGRPERIAGRFFLLERPTPRLLERLGFALGPPR